MANGAAVAKLVPPFAPAAVAPAACADAGVEGQIGELLVELATVSKQAWRETLEEGKVTPTTKMRGGELIAELYQLQFAPGQTDFDDTVRRIARLRLNQHQDTALSLAAVDEISAMFLGIITKVAAVMRAEMN